MSQNISSKWERADRVDRLTITQQPAGRFVEVSLCRMPLQFMDCRLPESAWDAIVCEWTARGAKEGFPESPGLYLVRRVGSAEWNFADIMDVRLNEAVMFCSHQLDKAFFEFFGPIIAFRRPDQSYAKPDGSEATQVSTLPPKIHDDYGSRP